MHGVSKVLEAACFAHTRHVRRAPRTHSARGPSLMPTAPYSAAHQLPSTIARVVAKDPTLEASSASESKRRERRAWFVVLVAFTADAFCLGGRTLFSVVLLYWEREFELSREYLSGAMALVHVTNGLSTPLAGHLTDILGARKAIVFGLIYLALCLSLTAAVTKPWTLWLFYGVMSGFAFGLLNLNVFSATVVRAMPPEKHGRAVGIATSGSTFGQLLLVPIFAVVAETFGWRAGYFSLAVATLLLAPIAWWVLDPLKSGAVPREPQRHGYSLPHMNDHVDIEERPNVTVSDHLHDGVVAEEVVADTRQNQDMASAGVADIGRGAGLTMAEERCKSDSVVRPSVSSLMEGSTLGLRAKCTNIVQSRAMWALTGAFIVCGITTTGFVEAHLVALATDRGHSESDGALALGVLSAFNGVGMITAGYLADRVACPKLLASIFLCRGLVYLLLLFARGTVSLFAFAVIFGLVDYSVVPPVVRMATVHMGDGSVGLAVGILLLFHSCGAALGAMLGGRCFDGNDCFDSSGYDPPIVTCATLCAIGALMCLSAPEHPPSLPTRKQRVGSVAAQRQPQTPGMKGRVPVYALPVTTSSLPVQGSRTFTDVLPAFDCSAS